MSRAPATVLVVDDDLSVHETLRRHLGAYRVLEAYNGRQAEDLLMTQHIDVVLLDIQMPGASGLELLAGWHRTWPAIEILMLTGYGSLGRAHAAGRDGACEFLDKCAESYEAIGEHIARALQRRAERRASAARGLAANFTRSWRTFVEAPSPASRRMMLALRGRAADAAPLLLRGERGTGKRTLAEYAHFHSPRAAGDFVAFDAEQDEDALRVLFGTGEDPGRVELAAGGTLFIAHIDVLPGAAQLRLVELIGGGAGLPDVRLIASTTRGAGALAADTTQALGLWYRLEADAVEVPPLRERREDIPLLVAGILEGVGAAATDDACAALRAHGWPGNTAELVRVLLRVAARKGGGVLGVADLPVELCAAHLSERGALAADVRAAALRPFEIAFLEDLVSRFAVAHTLPPLERSVLRLLVLDRSKEEVAAELGLGISVVHRCISDLLARTGQARVDHLVRLVRRQVLLMNQP